MKVKLSTEAIEKCIEYVSKSPIPTFIITGRAEMLEQAHAELQSLIAQAMKTEAAYAEGERATKSALIKWCLDNEDGDEEFLAIIRALPVEAAPAKSDEIAWLAEALVPPRDGNPGTVHWVNMEHGALGFTTDSYKALRFSRKEDVEAIATLYGFQGQNLKPVEHMWSGGPGAPSEAGSKK